LYSGHLYSKNIDGIIMIQPSPLQSPPSPPQLSHKAGTQVHQPDVRFIQFNLTPQRLLLQESHVKGFAWIDELNIHYSVGVKVKCGIK
jgi:hypothetical protein